MIDHALNLRGRLALAACLLTCAAGCQTTTTSAPEKAAKPQSVILFVGDGMGVSTITAARIYAGQKAGLPGEAHSLHFEELPNLALIKTYNTDLQVPDSAGTMTAMVTGVKTRAGVLSVPPSVTRGNCPASLDAPLPTLLEEAEALGLRTGLVSTARITHATPAANFAHAPDRNWEDDAGMPPAARRAGCRDIARQFAEFAGGDGIDVTLGGGRANFLPEGTADPESGKPVGRRKDGRDLTAEWVAAGEQRRLIWDRSGLAAAMSEAVPGETQLLGLFEPSHMQFEADRDEDAEPSLAEMTVAAIDLLSTNNADGYYLVVEGGRIDHAHHAGNAYRALEDTLAFDAAVAAALERVDLENTLIIVTADHSHTLTISGYPARGNPILGKVRLPTGALMRDANGRPYTTLGYANGPGAEAGRNLTDVDTEAKDFLQPATVPMAAETHAGEDVAAFAIGPQAEAVRGVMDQNELHSVMQAVLFDGRQP